MAPLYQYSFCTHTPIRSTIMLPLFVPAHNSTLRENIQLRRLVSRTFSSKSYSSFQIARAYVEDPPLGELGGNTVALSVAHASNVPFHDVEYVAAGGELTWSLPYGVPQPIDRARLPENRETAGEHHATTTASCADRMLLHTAHCTTRCSLEMFGERKRDWGPAPDALSRMS